MAPKKAPAHIKKNVSLEDLPISAGGDESPRGELTDRELLLKILDIVTELKSASAEKPKKTTKSGPKKGDTKTTYSWFVDSCEKDNLLFQAVMEGSNPEIWPYGAFKDKFQEITEGKDPAGDDIATVRRKSAVILWTKCMKTVHHNTIEVYHLNTSPETFPPARLKKVSAIRDSATAEPASPATKPARKPAAKKPAAKSKKKVDINSSSSDDEEASPQPKPAPKSRAKKSAPPPDSDSESD